MPPPLTQNPNSCLGSSVATLGNIAGSGDTELSSIVIPEDTLLVTGDYVEFFFNCFFAANVNAKRYRIEFVDSQGNAFPILDTALSAFNNIRILGWGRLARRASAAGNAYRCGGCIIGNNAFGTIVNTADSTILGGGSFENTINRLRSVANGVGANDVLEFLLNMSHTRNIF